MAETTQPTPQPKKDTLSVLKEALKLAQETHLVTPEENEAKVASALKDAKKLLKQLRGEPVANFFDIDSEDRAVPENGGNCRCCGGKGEHDTGAECYGCDASGLDRDYAGPNPCDNAKEKEDDAEHDENVGFNGLIIKEVNAKITPDEQRQIDLATEQFKQSVQRVDNQILNMYVQAVQNGDYAEAEAILANAIESQQTNTLMFALLTIGVILLPLYARQRISALFRQFGLHTVFARTDKTENDLRLQAKRGAESHVRTIAKDIKNSLDDAIDDQLTNPSIEAQVKDKYEETADKDGKAFVTKVKSNTEIYAFARDAILRGETRQSVIKALQENFSEIGKKRANVIAGNEANRVFTMSQFDADQQFLAQNKLTPKAYKRLVSNTGHPEAICKYIIDKTAAEPIPFTQDFVPFGKTITVKDNGKTYKFTANYEKLQSGHIHVNCHCRYELLIKQDDGSFFNTYDGKVLNEVAFEEKKHKRDKDGKFAKKAGVKDLDLSAIDNVKDFNKMIETAYFEGSMGHHSEDVTDSVRAYQGHFYDAINIHARSQMLDDPLTFYGNESTYGEVIDNINAAANMSLSSKVLVYRGTEIPHHQLLDVGEVVSARSFVSTSVDKKIAGKFQPKDGSMFVITAKKGQKVIVPDYVTYGKRGITMGEAEVLMPSDSVLTITKIDGDTVYAELN